MRMLLNIVIPVQTGNAAVREGKLGSTLQQIIADLKPEAAYFTETNGTRSGFIFFDMKDSSQLTAIAEPWFLAFNATVSVKPAMNAQDLAAGAASIESAAKAYPKTFGS
jgi:hypothetical protein